MAFLASAGCFWRAGPEKPEGDVPRSVSFNIGAQLHFNKDGFLGWLQMLSLKVTL